MIEMTRHRSPESVSNAWSHACDVHRDLDDLLLVEDHSERVFENRLQQRVRIGHWLAALLAPDVGMDCVALDRSGTDDRDLDHQVVEGLGPRPGQCLHLRARLDLEDADGVGVAARFEDPGVVQRELVEVRPDAGGVFDELETFRDDGECSQPEHVHLDEPEVLDVVLVELDDPSSFHRRRLDRRDVHQRLAGHEHSAVMDRKVAREVDHLAAQLEEVLPALRPHVGRRDRAEHRVLDVLAEPAIYAFRQPVEHLGRESERLADLPDGHSRLECDDVAHHPGALPAVLVVDVLDHLLAVLGREVDVDVGGAGHLLVQEALEQQVVLDGIDAGDAEDVGDDGVGG